MSEGGRDRSRRRAARWRSRSPTPSASTAIATSSVELIARHVDILFANESEITSLYQVGEFDAALQRVRRDVEFAALTRGPRGSLVVRGDEIHVIDAVPPERVLDTTGAGDLYAAGFLRGLSAELDLAACGRLASACAAQIIGQYGARAERPLLPLFEAVAAER